MEPIGFFSLGLLKNFLTKKQNDHEQRLIRPEWKREK